MRKTGEPHLNSPFFLTNYDNRKRNEIIKEKMSLFTINDMQNKALSEECDFILKGTFPPKKTKTFQELQLPLVSLPPSHSTDFFLASWSDVEICSFVFFSCFWPTGKAKST